MKPVEARPLRRTGYRVESSSISATSNVDYAILAARLPAAQLGYYVRAFQLGSDYQSKISGAHLRVSFPVFSRAADLEQLRRVRARMVRVHAAVIFPLLFLLIVDGARARPVALRRAVDARRSGSTQILAVVGMVACVGHGHRPAAARRAGRPGVLLGLRHRRLRRRTPPRVALAVPYGLTAVCITVVGIKVLSLLVLLDVIERWRRYLGRRDPAQRRRRRPASPGSALLCRRLAARPSCCRVRCRPSFVIAAAAAGWTALVYAALPQAPLPGDVRGISRLLVRLECSRTGARRLPAPPSRGRLAR